MTDLATLSHGAGDAASVQSVVCRPTANTDVVVDAETRYAVDVAAVKATADSKWTVAEGGCCCCLVVKNWTKKSEEMLTGWQNSAVATVRGRS